MSGNGKKTGCVCVQLSVGLNIHTSRQLVTLRPNFTTRWKKNLWTNVTETKTTVKKFKRVKLSLGRNMWIELSLGPNAGGLNVKAP
jgi:hypothetical protein